MVLLDTEFMDNLLKYRYVINFLEKNFIKRFNNFLLPKYNLSFINTSRIQWLDGIKSELQFWDLYFRTNGIYWIEEYKGRLNPDLPLQSRPAELLPDDEDIEILDVGAGPLTYLGKKHNYKNLRITATDPLADEYNILLKRFNIVPIVMTQRIEAEHLNKKFRSNTFDLVNARNCIDHTYNPERAILQMVRVVKEGRYILLEHKPNEAINEDYKGLHQWNFSMSDDNDFIISSKYNKVNMKKNTVRYLK